MKHDEAHEKKQNKALEAVIDALIEHIERDVPHASDTLLKLQAVRDGLVADDKDGEALPAKSTADKVDWSEVSKAKSDAPTRPSLKPAG